MATSKIYTVIKNGTVIKDEIVSLAEAKGIAKKEKADVFCGGKCVYQSVDVSGGYVLKATMNIRKGASPEAEIIGYAKKGTVVDTVDIKNGWLEIKRNGQTAYIFYGNGKYAEKCTQD